MKKLVSNLTMAAKTAIKGCGEAYHCNAAIAEYGEAKVIEQRATDLSNKYPTFSTAERTILAAREVAFLQEVTHGERPYFDVRTQLNQAQQRTSESQGKKGGSSLSGATGTLA